MKRHIFPLAAAALMALVSCDPGVPQLGKSSVDDVVAAMTLEEKVQLLIGTGMAGASGDSAVVGETRKLVPGAAGTTYPIPRLGIPAIVLADGPAGLRIQPRREGDSINTYYCTAFPVGTLLASTWNTDLVESVGQSIGNEVLEYGVDVLLGPALNIHRNPLCGRNFEYYSEDPLLSGKMAAAMIKGVQSNDVGTSAKHFVANNQETNRMANDVIASQRTLREIYYKGFEIAVREAQPWTVMTSYNKINGTYTSEDRALLTDILRGEWGFEGTVMTDWFGGTNPPAQVHAGNDLLMPGIPRQYDAIMAAAKDSTLVMADIDTNVRRILELILRTPRFKGYAFSNKPDLKAHAAVTRESATEGMVLLKNDNAALPLAAGVKSVAAFGITSYEFISGGTGSGDVNEAYTVSLKEGLANAGYSFCAPLAEVYETHIAAENERNAPDPKNPYAMFMPRKRAAEIVPTPAQLKESVDGSDIALVTIGRNSGEFADRQLTDDYEMSAIEKRLIKAVCDAYHAAGKRVVVVLNIGGVIETASWKDMPDAILLAWQPGQEGGNSVADVLKGAVNPSGRLPMTFPLAYMDIASSANFPYDYVAGAPVFFPTDSVKKESVRNVDYTRYEEGIYVGYRYFDTRGKDVSYPFGYGLSYTTFEYGDPQLTPADGAFTVKLAVKNTGSLPGKEVVQLYVSAPGGQLDKPAKELRAFAKTPLLQSGESQTVELRFSLDDLASYDENASTWMVENGEYVVRLGPSSRNILKTVNFPVKSKPLS